MYSQRVMNDESVLKIQFQATQDGEVLEIIGPFDKKKAWKIIDAMTWAYIQGLNDGEVVEP